MHLLFKASPQPLLPTHNCLTTTLSTNQVHMPLTRHPMHIHKHQLVHLLPPIMSSLVLSRLINSGSAFTHLKLSTMALSPFLISYPLP